MPEKKEITKKSDEKKTSAKPTKATKPVATKSLNKVELMEKHQKMIQFLQNTVSSIETDIKRLKLILNQLSKFDPEDVNSLQESEEIQKAI